jgi:histone H3/H4
MARVKTKPSQTKPSQFDRTNGRTWSQNYTAGSYPAARIFRTAREERNAEIAIYNREKAQWERRNPGKYPIAAPTPLPARAGVPSTVTRAEMEIAHYTQGTGLLLPRTTFARLVREVTSQIVLGEDTRFQSGAMLALQEGCEAYLVSFFEASLKAATHAKRKTVMQSDMQLVKWFQGSSVVRVSSAHRI